MASELCSVTQKLIQSNTQHNFTYLSYKFRLTQRSHHKAVQIHKNKLFISYMFVTQQTIARSGYPELEDKL
jgi:hypothetical protein